MRSWMLGVALLATASPCFAGGLDGWYVGGGGAVGTSTDRVFPWYEGSKMDSPSIVGFGGYNFTHGDFVFGPELSVRANTRPQTIGYSEWTSGVLHTQKSTYEETFSPSLSFRAGINVNDLTFYGRAGIGTTRIKYVGVETTPSVTDVSDDHMTGTAFSGAVGAEYNFDRLFFRLEGEARRLSFDTFGITEYQANAGIGVRF